MVETKKTVAIGLSRRNFSQRIEVTKFVISKGYIPLYPGITQDWYRIETKKVDMKDDMQDIIKKADEFWVFGTLSEDLEANIKLAKRLGRPVRFFSIGAEIREIDQNEMQFEEGFRRK